MASSYLKIVFLQKSGQYFLHTGGPVAREFQRILFWRFARGEPTGRQNIFKLLFPGGPGERYLSTFKQSM